MNNMNGLILPSHHISFTFYIIKLHLFLSSQATQQIFRLPLAQLSHHLGR